ncbi:MAG: tyrosine-type recombinase/integrase [Proteobacteria bacterium]|nr:tyrosine-type recombinase/integrase [Pseudomonadota bacterium]
MKGCLRNKLGIWYYRRRVPQKFYPKYFKGREISKSLNIKVNGYTNERLAQASAKNWDIRVDKVFYFLGLESMSTEQKKAIVEAEIYPLATKPELPTPTLPPVVRKRLNDLFDAYIKRHEKNWRFGSRADAVYALWLANEILENPIPDEITYDDIDRLVETICLLPKNITRDKVYKDLSVKEIIYLIENAPAENKPIPMSSTTVIKNLIWIKAVFDEEKIDIFDKAVFPKRSKRGGAKRVPFELDEVQKLLNLIKWQPRYPERLWVPLISLCHGLRAGEACQLRSDEIFSDDGEPCIRVTFEDDKVGGRHVKGENVRLLPLHPFLVELGLLKYAQVMHRAGHVQLFHQITPRKNGESFSHDFTNWASRGFVNKVTNDTRKTFHSLRHGFITYLNSQPYVKEHYISYLVGHSNVENATMTSKIYTHSDDYNMLKQALNTLFIDKLEWQSVKNEITKIEELAGHIDYEYVEIHAIEQPKEDVREQ